MEDIFEEITDKLQELKSGCERSEKSLREEIDRLNNDAERFKKTIRAQYEALTGLREIIAGKDANACSTTIEAIKNEIRFLHGKVFNSCTPQHNDCIMCLRHIVHIITGKSPHMGVYQKRRDESLGYPVADAELTDWCI